MLVVKKVMPDTVAQLKPLSDASLIGEETMLRIGRSGFFLSYAPLSKAEWRTFAPDARVVPDIICRREDAALYAAFQEGVCIGRACVIATDSGWADLADIRVDAAHRRMGVARALLDACERFAGKRHMAGLRLSASDQNPVICQFCEHCGFTLQGLDRMTLILGETERVKPLPRRACALYFYRVFEKG